MPGIEILLAFLEGVAIILSPCILPILPLILSASVDGGHKRPFGIILGFILAFTFFALLSRELVAIFQVDLTHLKIGALIFLSLFALLLLSEKCLQQFNRLTQGAASAGSLLTTRAQEGFFSGIVIGVFIGLIWTPCAGPILAVALVQVIRQQESRSAALLIIAFALGSGLPMLAISLLGRQCMTKLSFLRNHSGYVHKVLGVLILLTVLFIAGGFRMPALFSTNNPALSDLTAGLAAYPAPDFAPSNQWLNTPGNQPLTMAALRGQVVLVDFWTYSCINCLRTLPYMNQLYQKYHDKGLVIVGVHAPEFEFEKDAANVRQAIARYKILYPVALDNQLDTWTNFNNHYWPAHYLINQAGQVAATHKGEGDYLETEKAIRQLLGLNTKLPTTKETPLAQARTPETYLGYERGRAFQGLDRTTFNRPTLYTLPRLIAANHWALSGRWSMQRQRIVSEEAGGQLALNFTAKHVYLVLGNATDAPIHLALTLDGEAIKASRAMDAPEGSVTVEPGYRLYELVNQPASAKRLLTITTLQPGLEAYAFTFG